MQHQPYYPQSHIDPKSLFKQDLKKLQDLSREIGKIIETLPVVNEPIQKASMEKKFNELQVEQNNLIHKLVGLAPNSPEKQEFNKITVEIETLKRKILTCDEASELSSLESKINSTVDRWTDAFQKVVAKLLV